MTDRTGWTGPAEALGSRVDRTSYRDAGVQYIVLDTFYSAPELEHETIDSILGAIERFAAAVMPGFVTGE